MSRVRCTVEVDGDTTEVEAANHNAAMMKASKHIDGESVIDCEAI